MNYKELTENERYQIYVMNKAGHSQIEIAQLLYRNASTISRKLRRNSKRLFDLVKDFGTSQSTKIDSIFDSLLSPDRPAYVTIPYCTSTASCSCTTPS
ncbi:MAG: helix-turn-helix domain-containing protein [Candidatus Thiodiazotropha sp. (ex Lucinoma aequizonata)]|nr:helix-turn-helix domain-containing protein [Candidatus Thiodiazotropha sp. (ex Lucinoma aequizonata)]MCU7895449.1 helix-turn-helix domain-containing protein [Candidatus Thiodiazotropha sp. (ex Lucinoma aequizonata)]MCU7903168.1 helix-turn-helix domain-containing protein [Candidatus Thiodiazotropha sp. (ex Lucinoma aequizonata)]